MLAEFANIAIAVNDIDAAIKHYESAFGWSLEREVTTQVSLRIKTAILSADGLSIELISPLPGEAVLRRFLETRGEGFYRVAFRTQHCDEVLSRLDDHGVRHVELAADGGQRIVFTAPKSAHGLLVEYVEAVQG